MKRNRSAGIPDTARAVTTADGPGMGDNGEPAGYSSLHQLKPRIAYAGSARVGDQGHVPISQRRDDHGYLLRLVMVVVAGETGMDVVVGDKLARGPGVFGRDYPCLLQNSQRPEGDVLQVPYGSGYHVEGGHVASLRKVRLGGWSSFYTISPRNTRFGLRQWYTCSEPVSECLSANMNIGVCRIDLELPASHSLKDKRRVLRSIVARVQSRFNVAIAEVDQNDSWQAATLGITCVSNDSRHANAMLSSVVQFIQGCREEAVLADYQVEMLSGM